MLADPQTVNTTVGTPITIKYDASGICHGQMYADPQGRRHDSGAMGPVGTVIWQPGIIQDLPEVWGSVGFQGYTQVTTRGIRIDIGVRCLDNDCDSFCSVSAVIPVVVK
jgi:hypothetical protein